MARVDSTMMAAQGVTAQAGVRPAPVMWRRAALVATLLIAAGVTAWLLAPAAASGNDPALLRLLRMMMVLKALFVLGAALFVWQRLAQPIAPLRLAGYLAALGGATVAVTGLWSLTLMAAWIPLFYAGLVATALLARRDLACWRAQR